MIYLLQNLGFVINLKKSFLHPTQKIEFLGIIDSVEVTMSLPREKVQSIFKRCLDILSKQVSIKDLGKLLGAFSSTALAILPALLYMRFLEELNLVDIKPNTVKWEVSKVPPGQTFDTARCMKDRFGGFCQKTSIGGVWSQAEQHINILEI